jgi:hypothetical protein
MPDPQQEKPKVPSNQSQNEQSTPPRNPEKLVSQSENLSSLEDFFRAMVFSYSRADALEDGILVDVSDMAKEAGFLLPVAVSSALWGDINDIPEGSGQDVNGRLWDVLTMGNHAIHTAVARGNGNGTTLRYQVILTLPGGASEEESLYSVKSVIGPGDDGRPVLTLMQPHED